MLITSLKEICTTQKKTEENKMTTSHCPAAHTSVSIEPRLSVSSPLCVHTHQKSPHPEEALEIVFQTSCLPPVTH